MPRKARTQKRNKRQIKGGEMSDAEYNQYSIDHDFYTYDPQTPAEKAKYQEYAAKQKKYVSKLSTYEYLDPKGYQNWHQDYENGYNHAINTLTTAEEVYSPDTKPMTPVKSGFVPDLIDHPEEANYQFNGFEQGYNKALGKLWQTVPRPKKKGWADYFVDGLTMPFKVASMIPGLNAIPGIKQAANLSDVLQGSGLPYIKGNFIV